MADIEQGTQGPFAAEVVVLRGANAPDALPHHERRLDAEVAEQYGTGRSLAEVSQAWRPYRTWAAVHLRVLREQRTGEIAGRRATRRPDTLSDHDSDR